jgi:hypothetical protein
MTEISQMFPFLFKESMPVWLTLLVGIGAVIGTYLLAPAINKKLEISKHRSQHVAESIKHLNENFIKLSCNTRSLISSFVDGSGKTIELRDNCLDTIVGMQWKIVDVKIILKQRDLHLAEELGRNLNNFKDELLSVKTLQDQDKIISRLEDVSRSIREILDRMYRHAKLK